jgi:hypothetical protein
MTATVTSTPRAARDVDRSSAYGQTPPTPSAVIRTRRTAGLPCVGTVQLQF